VPSAPASVRWYGSHCSSRRRRCRPRLPNRSATKVRCAKRAANERQYRRHPRCSSRCRHCRKRRSGWCA
jgi:hypothetical protein